MNETADFLTGADGRQIARAIAAAILSRNVDLGRKAIGENASDAFWARYKIEGELASDLNRYADALDMVDRLTKEGRAA